ncbi:hypothetical protein FH972_018893 [Carpinus fangiana]|uniref:N-acetyltransferase domain-containing protein n=1 Tax=Carpinus fangiana TaxID=176857 RepID=A0A5N6RRS8_9ROSI|nr:hypothetical protein FH972_018893 [Carpinus fangiana]
MATAAVAVELTRKQPRPGRGGFEAHGLTEEEARVRAIAEIVNSMVDLSRKGQNVDLNALKSSACRKRPDYCLGPHLRQMLLYGCTRLEIGVQSTYEDVARDTNRGHTVAAVADCFCLAKDAGFKNSNCRYRNYPPEQLVDIVARILAMVPPWTRVYRVQRDIPMPLVTSGVEKGNLRELALARMEDLGLKCRDVRTREAGIQLVLAEIYCSLVFILLVGIPLFFTVQTFIFHHLFGHQDILVGLLRLRKCGRNTTCPELMGKCSIIRELHVYGTAVPVHGRDADKLQHQGYGTLLMEEAEQIARREHRSTKIAVISGVGTRHYYRKLGYELEGPYMVKCLA